MQQLMVTASREQTTEGCPHGWCLRTKGEKQVSFLSTALSRHKSILQLFQDA
jgi:hypothetical protein